MEPIGGYFSLELPRHEEYHKDAIKLNTGRNCLEYILRCRKYRKVFIPYYTCEVVLEPFHKLGIPYDFYHINRDFELTDDIKLGEGEALLYTNYYGLKQQYVEILAAKYGQQLIVDNTQAFYAKPVAGIDTFYTCRKFFGVPDGAYLYTDAVADFETEQDVSFDRMTFLTKRIDLGAEAGYADFQRHDESLINQPIKRMSRLTERLMQSVDYKQTAAQRHKNFLLLHEQLKDTNLLRINLEDETVPLVYPYMTDNSDLRQHFISNKVFVARYWPSVLDWCPDESSTEYRMTTQLLPIPIDQRYGEEEMKYIISIIQKK